MVFLFKGAAKVFDVWVADGAAMFSAVMFPFFNRVHAFFMRMFVTCSPKVTPDFSRMYLLMYGSVR